MIFGSKGVNLFRYNMHPDKKTILFTLIYKGEMFPVRVSCNEYRSLMNLITDQLDVPGFGTCSGTGSCGTCMVNINREGCNTLSCYLPVNDELANTVIEIEE